jgi:heme-degrading monooxygenase HmoA
MGYLGTELYRDPNQPRHYITIDHWNSSTDFDSFQEDHRLEYEAMDERCKSLTEYEARIGTGNLILST